jgi:hypothetical protein
MFFFLRFAETSGEMIYSTMESGYDGIDVLGEWQRF